MGGYLSGDAAPLRAVASVRRPVAMTERTGKGRADMAAVVIGRNEGARLEAALRSVEAAGLRVVYADSGSSDGSPDTAIRLGVPVVELDPKTPFSAGRGRNEGLEEAMRRWPEITYVLFLDGDCTLDPRFPSAAVATFDEHADCAIVTGHLSERFPERSIYNRLCAIEWRSRVGRIEDMRIGGIMIARISAFRAVGGFKPEVIAGEEPDLAARLGRAGFTLYRIDAAMAVHDANILSFGEWWKRAVRGGHGVAQLYDRHRRTDSPLGVREVRSAIFWGFVLPLLTVALLWPTRGLSLFLLGGYGLLGWRIFKHYSATDLSRSDAWLVTRFMLYSKFAEFFGILRYVFQAPTQTVSRQRF
jgi:GT2 family glycosyltransferase